MLVPFDAGEIQLGWHGRHQTTRYSAMLGATNRLFKRAVGSWPSSEEAKDEVLGLLVVAKSIRDYRKGN